MDEIVAEFLNETDEEIGALMDIITQLETRHDPELIIRSLRLVHTIKGNCGFVKFVNIETTAHEIENLLSQAEPDFQAVRTAAEKIRGILKAIISHADIASPPHEHKSLETILQNIALLARDLAVKSRKTADIQTSGPDIMLSRKTGTLLQDSLAHLLRNAIDHGLESPQERLAAGKTPKGQIRLEARQEDGQTLMLRLSDDGRGLNAGKIKASALKKGILDEKKAMTMDTEALYNLIFLPGFSTAEAITLLSGRGIGLDAVHQNIEDIGGSITVTSAPGKGTKFTIRIDIAGEMPV